MIPGMQEYVAEFTAEATWGNDGYLTDKGLIPLSDESRAEVAKNAANLASLDAKKTELNKRLKKRLNYNKKLIYNFRKIQKPLKEKKKLSNYIIKNNFKLSSIKKNVKLIKNQILNERNST